MLPRTREPGRSQQPEHSGKFNVGLPLRQLPSPEPKIQLCSGVNPTSSAAFQGSGATLPPLPSPCSWSQHLSHDLGWHRWAGTGVRTGRSAAATAKAKAAADGGAPPAAVRLSLGRHTAVLSEGVLRRGWWNCHCKRRIALAAKAPRLRRKGCPCVTRREHLVPAQQTERCSQIALRGALCSKAVCRPTAARAGTARWDGARTGAAGLGGGRGPGSARQRLIGNIPMGAPAPSARRRCQQMPAALEQTLSEQTPSWQTPT